jgi:hypothetical protein
MIYTGQHRAPETEQEIEVPASRWTRGVDWSKLTSQLKLGRGSQAESTSR